MHYATTERYEYEYRTIEWRSSDEQEAQSKLSRLFTEGWELHGEMGVKAGTFTDLYWQTIKRRKE